MNGKSKRRSGLLSRLAGVAVIAGLVTAALVTGCTGMDPTGLMSFEDLTAEFDALEDGGSYTFTLDQLTERARLQYLASIDRQADPVDRYLGVPITYEVTTNHSRGTGFCGGTSHTVDHMRYCGKRTRTVLKERFSTHNRCAHGFEPAPYGIRKVSECTNPSCPYVKDSRYYYHITP